jgi:phosphoglycerate dehydrogenase-like enzyme
MKVVAVYSPVLMKRDFVYEKGLLVRELKAQVVRLPHKGTGREELYEALKDADALLTDYQKVDGELLRHAPRLCCVSLLSTGYNVVDTKAAREAGVAVCNVREYCTEEVADHTMALLLALERNLRPYVTAVENGVWEFDAVRNAPRLQGQTLCLFGFGKISRAVARRAAPFGFRLTAVSRHASPEEAAQWGIRLISPEEAQETADIISNHMVLSEETKGYFNRDFFSKLQKQPVFLNLGRGGSVNEADLAEALDRGWVRAAGLDLLERENPDLTGNPLLGRENVIITPHAAFYSEASVEDMVRIACENLTACLKREDARVSGYVVPPGTRRCPAQEG